MRAAHWRLARHWDIKAVLRIKSILLRRVCRQPGLDCFTRNNFNTFFEWQKEICFVMENQYYRAEMRFCASFINDNRAFLDICSRYKHFFSGGYVDMREQFSRFFGFSEKNSGDEVQNIPVDEIVPSPYQPRIMFDEERIDELCQTIKTHGVIQPIVVRIRNNKYEIIAGERRFRAVKKLNYKTIPAIVREINDSQAASIALIENLQREGLTAIEEAAAYQQLIEMHNLTQESLAQRLGKSQSSIANKIRLLQLSEPVKNALLARKISERHARALLAIKSDDLQAKILNDIIEKDLNVKQTEARVQFYKQSEENTKKKNKRISFSKDIRLALNTIRQSVEMIKDSGINIKTNEKNYEDHVEITITIVKK
jgi:ParB family chromosome partitioning protein